MGVVITDKGKPGVTTRVEKTPNGMLKTVVITVEKPVPAPKAKKLPPPPKSLDQPGWLRVDDVIAFFAVSRTTLYNGIHIGRYPPPDGKDGRRPYWKTETIKRWLAGDVSPK